MIAFSEQSRPLPAQLHGNVPSFYYGGAHGSVGSAGTSMSTFFFKFL